MRWTMPKRCCFVRYMQKSFHFSSERAFICRSLLWHECQEQGLSGSEKKIWCRLKLWKERRWMFTRSFESDLLKFHLSSWGLLVAREISVEKTKSLKLQVLLCFCLSSTLPSSLDGFAKCFHWELQNQNQHKKSLCNLLANCREK